MANIDSPTSTTDGAPDEQAVEAQAELLAGVAAIVELTYDDTSERLRREYRERVAELDRNRDEECSRYAEQKHEDIKLAQREHQCYMGIIGKKRRENLITDADVQEKREASNERLRFEIDYSFELYHQIATDKDDKRRRLKEEATVRHRHELRQLATQKTNAYARMGISEGSNRRSPQVLTDTDDFTDSDADMLDRDDVETIRASSLVAPSYSLLTPTDIDDNEPSPLDLNDSDSTLTSLNDSDSTLTSVPDTESDSQSPSYPSENEPQFIEDFTASESPPTDDSEYVMTTTTSSESESDGQVNTPST